MKNLIIIWMLLLSPFLLFGQDLSDNVWNYSRLVEKDHSLKEKEIVEANYFLKGKKLCFIDFRENAVEKPDESALSKVSVENYQTPRYNEKNQKLAAINNKFLVNPSLMFDSILNRNIIEDVYAISGMKMDGVHKTYFNLTLKNNYLPQSISLARIKKKYTDLKDDVPVIFQINGKVIYTDDYDEFIVDENNVSQIVVDKSFGNEKEPLRMGVINLLLKTSDEFAKDEERYFRSTGKIMEKMDITKQKTGQSPHINWGKEMRFIDLWGNTIEDLEKDTLLNIPVIEKKRNQKRPFVSINGNLLVDASFLHDGVLNQDEIEDKDSYGGISLGSENQLRDYYDITMKDELYIPEVISLSQIKSTYSNLKNKPALFLINGKLIPADDCDAFQVDEKNLLKITVYESFKNTTDNFDVAIIDLTTCTKENIKKERKNGRLTYKF